MPLPGEQFQLTSRRLACNRKDSKQVQVREKEKAEADGGTATEYVWKRLDWANVNLVDLRCTAGVVTGVLHLGGFLLGYSLQGSETPCNILQEARAHQDAEVSQNTRSNAAVGPYCFDMSRKCIGICTSWCFGTPGV